MKFTDSLVGCLKKCGFIRLASFLEIRQSTRLSQHSMKKQHFQDFDFQQMIAGNRGGCYIYPESLKKLGWDVFVLVLVLLNSIMIPLEIAFTPSKSTAEEVVDEVIDSIFYIDIVLNFFCTFETAPYHYEKSYWRIFLKYKGWFVVDFLAAFPFELLAGASAATALSTVKVFRLLRLGRVFKFIDRFPAFSNGARFVVLGGAFLMCCHVLGCAWYFVGPDQDGWKSSFFGPDLQARDQLSVSARYTPCLYYVVVTILTVGYGDIVPETSYERVFSSVLIMFGAVVYALIFGS
mmetsp:Transcript_8684/g.16631  ORF Transcript_8684/g.16631 Transcript_8684/m.16631 type:complete len:292 (+) Transcript_8684:33-908(+)